MPVYESGKLNTSEKKRFCEASNLSPLPVDFYTVSASMEEICMGTIANLFHLFPHVLGMNMNILQTVSKIVVFEICINFWIPRATAIIVPV